MLQNKVKSWAKRTQEQTGTFLFSDQSEVQGILKHNRACLPLNLIRELD